MHPATQASRATPHCPTVCSFGNLASGATRTMTIQVHILPGFTGPLHNDARVSCNTFDNDLSDNLDTVVTEVAASADLSITKTDSPDPVLAGNDLTYTITVTNGGPSTATGGEGDRHAARRHDLRRGRRRERCDHLRARAAGTGGLRSRHDGARCDDHDLPHGDRRPVAAADAVLQNTATVSSPTPDPDPADNTGERVDRCRHRGGRLDRQDCGAAVRQPCAGDRLHAHRAQRHRVRIRRPVDADTQLRHRRTRRMRKTSW